VVFIDGSGNETLASADVFDPNTINGHVPQVTAGDFPNTVALGSLGE